MHFTLLTSTAHIVLCLLLPSVLAGGNIREIQPLKPYKQSTPTSQTTVLKGLLRARQSCPIGYGGCNNGGCCPLAGSCCGSDGCCDVGSLCCEGIGCIPILANCCKDGNYCDEGDECVVLSSGKGGCCPFGEICDDDGGNGGDGGGSGPKEGGGETTTEKRTTTKTTEKSTPTSSPHDSPQTTDLPKTTSIKIPTPSSNSTSTSAAVASSTSTPRPNPGPGQVPQSITVDDASITWSSGWITASSSCTSSARKTVTAMDSFTVMVSSASQIYLGIDCANADYGVYIDGQLNPFSDFDITETCSYKQLPAGESSFTINVTVVVIGLPMNARRQVGGALDWSFQLNEVLLMDSSGNSNATTAGSTSGALGPDVSLLNGLAAILFTGLGFVL